MAMSWSYVSSTAAYAVSRVGGFEHLAAGLGHRRRAAVQRVERERNVDDGAAGQTYLGTPATCHSRKL
jgi:hypothetical protein